MTDPLIAPLECLPHGPEFRFLDRLLQLEPGQRGVGEYTVPQDAEFLRGHFPGAPLLPGVLLIEALAQLAGVVAQSDPTRTPLVGLKLTAVRAAKILGSGAPGQRLRIEAEVRGRLGPLIHAGGSVLAGDLPVLQAEITLAGNLDPRADA